MSKTKIIAIEDFNGFWENLGNRNKLYKVEVNGKIYDRMELTYVNDRDEGESFKFTERR